MKIQNLNEAGKKMKKLIAFLPGLFLLLNLTNVSAANPKEKTKKPIFFVSFVLYEEQAKDCLTLIESIRKFAGSLKDTPIWVYCPDYMKQAVEKYKNEFLKFKVKFKDFKFPKEALKYDLGLKPFVAEQAEKDALEETDLLAYLDPNIIVLKEPKDFLLKPGKILGYRPVMHQNVGSLYSEEPDAFWSRIFEVLNVSESTLFPMEAIADKNILRPYFNAGLLIVRPQKLIFQKWAASFVTAYNDPKIADMCREGLHNIFLHQAVLTGAILNNLKQEELELLPFAYNYPLLFEKFYESKLTFDSIEDVIALKCEIFKKELPADWDKKLKGPPDVISWIKTRFQK